MFFHLTHENAYDHFPLHTKKSSHMATFFRKGAFIKKKNGRLVTSIKKVPRTDTTEIKKKKISFVDGNSEGCWSGYVRLTKGILIG